MDNGSSGPFVARGRRLRASAQAWAHAWLPVLRRGGQVLLSLLAVILAASLCSFGTINQPILRVIYDGMASFLDFLIHLGSFWSDVEGLVVSAYWHSLLVLALGIGVGLLLGVPIGFAATMVGVAGKAVLNEEAPEGRQGRVFATQGALSDALSLAPLFAIGGVAELVGVREVLLVAAVVAFLVGVYLSVSRRFGPPRSVRAEAGSSTSS